MSRLTHPLLQPWAPTATEPFDDVKVAHLLNRAGFGGTADEVSQFRELGVDKAVDRLLAFPDQSAEQIDPKGTPDLTGLEGFPADFAEIRKLYAGKTPEERMAIRQKMQAANQRAIRIVVLWWLKRMTTAAYPLQEKLALFWHGHFTTSATDERTAVNMWNQNELLRRMAAGNFHEFTRQVSRDPAMLSYLNNQQNRKGRPNENYARELLELFTLGIGNYTEQDIKEAARAFTGWMHDGDDYAFNKNLHDTGPKTFMGKTGAFGGDDIVQIIMEQPACGPYIAGRIWRFFVADNPDPALLNELGALLRNSKYELRPVLSAIFRSRGFFDRQVVGGMVKSPVQLLIGSIRMLGLDFPREALLMDSLRQMGQMPLYPPNVKGWPGGREWINASTLFVRHNVGVRLVGSVPARAVARTRHPFAPPAGVDTPAKVVDHWLTRLIQRPVPEARRQPLLDFLGNDAKDPEKIRQMVQLVLSMPEYQLC